ncbi:hypothetical protein [Actinospica robiniae]|uniref:hypothetical protein n=1 Tax=Actinospica robiniae TaxID=304901 RepID=UPI00040FE1D3|nr:hypothetical protein [Actinospica robiniae]
MTEQFLTVTRDRGRVARWLAIGFLVADAALNTVLIFQPYNTSVPSDQHLYDALTSMPDVLNFLLGALVCAALLVAPRTRNFAVGYGLGLCGLWFANVVCDLRWPKYGMGTQTTIDRCITGCQVLALPAAICVILLGLRGSGGQAPPAFERRPKPRPAVLITGLVTLALSLASDFVTTLHIAVPEQNGSTRSITCCTFGSLNAGAKADLFLSLALTIALILLAANVGSAATASGIFAGLFTTVVGGLAVYVAAICFPIEFHIGILNRAIPAGTVLHASAYPEYSPRVGFWLATTAVLALGALAFISGLMYRSARDIHHTRAYHVPDTGLQRME